MSGIKIHFDFTLSPALTRCGLAGLMMLASAPELSSESVTLSTYYPAPSGVYTQMITTGITYLARDGGNVGVGTIAPLAKLDINGNMTLSGVLPQTLSYGANAVIGVPVANTLTFATSGVERMRVQDNGFVGIGTTNPLMPLDVNGNVVVRGCAGVATTSYPMVGPSTVCPGGRYATWARGVMVKEMRADNAYFPSPSVPGPPLFGTMFCCPCPTGTCPSL